MIVVSTLPISWSNKQLIHERETIFTKQFFILQKKNERETVRLIVRNGYRVANAY